MRAFLACFFLIFLERPADAAEAWARFPDPVGNFTIEFPHLPRVTTMTGTSLAGENVPITSYAVQDDVSVMMVMDAPVLNRTDPFFKIIESAGNRLLGAAASANGTMQSDMQDLLDGQVGRRISILRTDGSVETTRLFDVNSHLYRVVTIAPAGNSARTADAVRFIESLRLTAPQR